MAGDPAHRLRIQQVQAAAEQTEAARQASHAPDASSGGHAGVSVEDPSADDLGSLGFESLGWPPFSEAFGD